MKELKKLKRLKLNENEKNDMRNSLIKVIQNNPHVRNLNNDRLIYQKHNLFLIKHPMFASLIIAAILALGGGTVAAAAEQATPGSALYPVKLHLNENVRSAIAIGEEKEANWQEQKIGRRLEEAGKLISKNGLTEEKEKQIEAKFDEHTKKIQELITKLEEKGNTEAASNVRRALDARIAAFNDLGETIKKEKPEDGEKIKKMMEKIVDDKKAVKDIVDPIKEKIKEHKEENKEEKTIEPVQNVMNVAEKKIAAVKTYFNENKDTFSEDIKKTADEKLAEVDKLFNEAKSKMEKNEYNDAFELFKKAQFEAQRVNVIMHSSKVFEKKEEIKAKLGNKIENSKDKIEQETEN